VYANICISVLPLNSALESLINFAYNGHIAIDQQNVQALLIGASFLQLQNVKDACCSFLQQRYCLNNYDFFMTYSIDIELTLYNKVALVNMNLE